MNEDLIQEFCCFLGKYFVGYRIQVLNSFVPLFDALSVGHGVVTIALAQTFYPQGQPDMMIKYGIDQNAKIIVAALQGRHA